MSPTSQSATAAERRFPWGVVAVLSIALFGALTGHVDASCGDYLHRDLTVENDVPVQIGTEQPERGHGSGPTCSGPTCRRAPESPTRSLPGEHAPSNIERLALLSTAGFHCGEESARLRPGNPFLQTEDHRRDLDRPPRSR